MRFHSVKKKMAVESKNRKIMRIEVLVPEMKKLVICVFAVEHAVVTMSVYARNFKRHHIHNSVFFVCFIFI